ncbi:MAG: capsular polysaccharide biosynthesis protein [Coprococcus sp.]|nr:capsular polysaccharide biosynthesis protein [Coprococcus sp.]
MGIIDFHTHVLPGIDDGSKNIETSIKMLDRCAENGVKLMVATPHFYADINSIESFLENREAAYHKLMAARGNKKPDILLGAEVAFFKGISKAEKLQPLLIEGTNIMLLEMPFTTWDDSVLREVEYLISQRGFRIVIAHLERFMRFSGNKAYIKKLLSLPVLVQINAESLTDLRQRNKLIRLFQKKQAHLLGSDCHGLHHRPPNIWEGRAVIENKLGIEYINRMDELGALLLKR